MCKKNVRTKTIQTHKPRYCEKEKDKANKRILRSLSFDNNGFVKPSCGTVAKLKLQFFCWLCPFLFHNTLACVFFFTLLAVIKLIKDHWQDQDI
jgi:hypothetical protein